MKRPSRDDGLARCHRQGQFCPSVASATASHSLFDEPPAYAAAAGRRRDPGDIAGRDESAVGQLAVGARSGSAVAELGGRMDAAMGC